VISIVKQAILSL